MNLGKWIRPMIVAMLFGAFLTGQSRYAMAEETEAETASPSATAAAQMKETNNVTETEEQMKEPEDADPPEDTKEMQGIEILSAIDGDCTLTMRREDGRLFSEESMTQIELLSGEEETRAQSLLSAKIASDFVLTNPDVPFNEEDIQNMTQEIRDNFLSFSVFRTGVTGPDEGCGVIASLSVPDLGLSDYSSMGCRNIVFQVGADWNLAVIDNDDLSFEGGCTSFCVEGSGTLIFGIAQFPSDWLYSGLNEVMMRRINEVIAKENGTEEEADSSDDVTESAEDTTGKNPDKGSEDESKKAEDTLTADLGDLTLHVLHENGAPFDRGTEMEVKDMEKEAAAEFRKAICEETGQKKLSQFAPYQITFRKADGSSYTLWHLILEAENSGPDRKLAVMTRDGKIKLSDIFSKGKLELSSETIAAAALFSASS